MAGTGALPEADEVWDRVVTFAKRAKTNGTRIYTLSRRVPNTIAAVDKISGIERRSRDGITNRRRVTRTQVEAVWNVVRRGRSWQAADRRVLYFTPALIQAAMDALLERDEDLGEIRLRA